MKKPKQKPLRIIEKPLLEKDGAFGVWWMDTNIINIDPRLTARTYLEILCHEVAHALRPKLPEKASEVWANEAGQVLAKAIWGQGFRRIAK